MRNKKLFVHANPLAALDVDGRAQGAVPHEGRSDAFVGAILDAEASRATGKVLYRFTERPVEVPWSAYYVRKLQDKELLPANAETARAAGLKGEFVEPKTVLDRERSRLASEFEQAHGFPPAFAQKPTTSELTPTPTAARAEH